MKKGTILFADDKPLFHKTWKKHLENAGYTVISAYTPDEAKRILNEDNLDLAVLDMRLERPRDKTDISGITVAKEAGRHVPKIILTSYPSYETFRESMQWAFQGLPLAVDYIDKKEGPEELLKAIEKAMKLRVFIVHGHSPIKDTVARFIEDLGLWAVILDEQASGGHTIISKFERNSNVGFAVALLTADDVGRQKGRTKELKFRARQNVIFELGYFTAKLSRQKVAALYQEGVELPSDYYGVVYIPLNKSNKWQELLKREIINAGIPVRR